ncbi:F-box domain, FBD domain, Leucine-rich repeat domain, L domain-like protein [Artemisia annua]|uniref:F-box domain, FBD domain, Leucine-rich repeat domain, L domain-like protein n=1 Tax=Artemisia annua TaxID=35608 RepID=A0A2U1N756_ARTAN|nr:F-box domain, FBD domain, Leucine-rich repeat domain, L domain-like protein [Artemisia annua]
MKKPNIENGVDHISNLPDPILHSILSRLHSTEEVVRNSVLSTRWKYLWTSIPSINLMRGPKPFGENKFKEFVYWVLANRTQDLDSFSLRCLNHYDMRTIGRWIHLVVMRKVKKLTLSLCCGVNDEAIVLPRCLVDCDSLEKLVLALYLDSLKMKSFTGSKTLKVLRLHNVELLDNDLVQQFLANCPLLEDLSFIDCLTYNLDSVVISCPNLKTLRIYNKGLDYDSVIKRKKYEEEKLCERLTLICPKLVYLGYEGHMANHFAFDVKSLKKAMIVLEDVDEKAENDENFGVTVCELLAQVSHVEWLSITYFFLQSISFTCECCKCDRLEEGFPETFPNLKKLRIVTDCFLMDVLIRILKCSPNLEFLHLIITEVYISSEELETFIEKLDEVETRTILTRHLKKLEFFNFVGEKETLAIARFLLEHGTALEELVFSWNNKDNYSKHSGEAMNEVSKFYKASSSVKVITLLENQ